jgi:hypothetical protein
VFRFYKYADTAAVSSAHTDAQIIERPMNELAITRSAAPGLDGKRSIGANETNHGAGRLRGG